jgi:hypothetical protein
MSLWASYLEVEIVIAETMHNKKQQPQPQQVYSPGPDRNADLSNPSPSTIPSTDTKPKTDHLEVSNKMTDKLLSSLALRYRNTPNPNPSSSPISNPNANTIDELSYLTLTPGALELYTVAIFQLALRLRDGDWHGNSTSTPNPNPNPNGAGGSRVSGEGGSGSFCLSLAGVHKAVHIMLSLSGVIQGGYRDILRGKKEKKGQKGQKGLQVEDSGPNLLDISQASHNLQEKAMQLTLDLGTSMSREREDRERERSLTVNSIRLVAVQSVTDIDSTPSLYYIIVFLAWLQFLGGLLQGDKGGGVSAGDEVFRAAIDMLSQLLYSNPKPNPGSDTNVKEDNGRENMRFLLPFQNKGGGAAAADNRRREREEAGAGTMSGSEVTCSICIERLHLARVAFLKAAETMPLALNGSTMILGAKLLPQHGPCPSLVGAIYRGLEDCPLSPSLLGLLLRHEGRRPAGYIRMRGYFKGVCIEGERERVPLIVLLGSVMCEVQRGGKVAEMDRHLRSYNTIEGNNNDSDNNINNINKNNNIFPFPISFYGWNEESLERLRALLEIIVTTDYYYPFFWILYILLECERQQPENGKKIFFRAVNVVGYSRELWLLALGPLRVVFSEKEIRSLLVVMGEEKNLMLRTG